MPSNSIYVLAPSFFALAISGFLLLAYVFVLVTHFSSFLKIDYTKQLQIIGIFALAIGVHGSLHLGLENTYNFNPYSLLMR
jgi:uncharacterized membrane protein